MNPDQLALSGFEQALRDDTQGRLLKSHTELFKQQTHAVNARINAGVTADEYEVLHRLKDTLGTANGVLSKVWHGFHAT